MTIYEVCVFLKFDDGTQLVRVIERTTTLGKAEEYKASADEGLSNLLEDPVGESGMTAQDFLGVFGIVGIEHKIAHGQLDGTQIVAPH